MASHLEPGLRTSDQTSGDGPLLAIMAIASAGTGLTVRRLPPKLPSKPARASMGRNKLSRFNEGETHASASHRIIVAASLACSTASAQQMKSSNDAGAFL